MVSRTAFLIFVTLVVTGTHAATMLDADFEDKPLDTPIGTGGASVGEPTSIGTGVSAIVRNSPTATKSLELQDIVDFGAHGARFEFINQGEIIAGTVTISLDLWFTELEDYTLAVRESQHSGSSFTSLALSGSGHVMYSDADSPGNTVIGTYELGRSMPLRIEYDMDAGTYDLEFDGDLLLEDETHGIIDHGVGSVTVGINHDSDFLGTVYVDNILVEVPSLFEDGFESSDTSLWSVTSQ